MGTPILVTGAAGRVGGVGGGGEASRIKALINMSQMTRSQMSITETTPSPQHKLQWLAEQALN